ncbi:Glucosamine--fructose-6-phosphate aminotransferase (isomerizing) [Caldithrix abyssi DSM 13497]|uniref:Glutamine--fructose-6-phosphate aminotransferase [isomerizing] n=1 Tax=Caldithrix abyssi DSM 13497 TaxID=880073 RepID=H1XTH9_CALAY|nr:glutamine--fructose-6-phosphate transaminase (isomerizing) [Caldithrix abyssi]APF16947.1 glmS glucosamine--fructose-6-phosphate aminotransferase (isomerizing) [Caldithrix abyssi DSM 13497]EHO40412.1 Glucosamine--fructose-6-phosphate aminotransferase (isomerizing) [Caldithrix abyssi DSM 13497]
MCGIVGYLGNREAALILINGLKRLEYRGYDSAGIATLSNGDMFVVKEVGKIRKLEEAIAEKTPPGTVGIGHTRWATHGKPNQINAHPHTDCSGKIVLIHNGIIENYSVLKQLLEKTGHSFKSDTDTEIVAHLIEELYDGTNFEQAFREALQRIEGTFGIAVLNKDEPDKIYVARKGSPIVIGVGEDEYFVASDVTPLIPHTRNVFYLEDDEMAILTRQGIITKTIQNKVVEKQVQRITLQLDDIEKQGFEHYMLKEIFEQPKTIMDTMRGRILREEGLVKLGGLAEVEDKLMHAGRIIIVASGTSWHAGLIGEYLLEEFCRIPVEVEYASEFRYRNPIINENDIIIAISQSGETADTLAALREGKHKGALVLGIVNAVGSTIARETHAGVYIHAGPEIGVASTKAFTSQVTALVLITILIARKKYMSVVQGKQMLDDLQKIPANVEKILAQNDYIRELAETYYSQRNFLYLGRGYNFPVALEGALKLKEISYIHAEGYPAAEMKHGPIALIDENMPVVFIATQDAIYDKVISNIQEVKARKGRVICVANEGDEQIEKHADHVIYIPYTCKALTPLLSVIPLQLLAYHIAVLRGCDVDQPRNLAKSVTVE